MKLLFRLIWLVALSLSAVPGQAGEEVFGPAKYDVVERLGLENRYQGAFKAAPGLYLVKVQNGERWAERTDRIELSMNGETVIREGEYTFGVLAVFLQLKKDNVFELVIKDAKYTGQKPPSPKPKNVIITVLPAPYKITDMVLGFREWDNLKEYANALLKITAPASASAARSAANLKNTTEARSAAVRELSDQKDPAALDLLLHFLSDGLDAPDVRGEAALALGLLGDKAAVPALAREMFNPEEKLGIGVMRALSLFKEEDAREAVVKQLKTISPDIKPHVMRSMASGGWKPVGILIELTESADPMVANLGIELLTGARDAAVVDLLLKYLGNPGSRDEKLIIIALGATKDNRAIGLITSRAKDPEKRKGLEAALGKALAEFGDRSFSELIVEMINNVENKSDRKQLRAAYKQLTGKPYKQ